MFLLDICKFIENIIYLPFKLFRVKNKVTFISRQSNQTPLEFQKIIDGISKDKVKIVSIAKKLSFSPKSLIVNFLLFFKEMYHISTSKVLIVDGYCIMASTLWHKKSLTIIQTWHANAIIKKIGLQTLSSRSNLQRRLAVKMNMHKNYDYVLSSSPATSEVYKEAFNVKTKNILEYGTPMLDYLYNKEYQIDKDDQLYDCHGKKNVIYMPTVRKGEKLNMDSLINNFNFEKYNLYLRLHPAYKDDNIDKRINLITKYTAEQLISVADYVITDYSNVAFEAGLEKVPVLLYVPDIKVYRNNPGLNIDVSKEYKKYTSTNINEILDMMEQKYDFAYLNRFVKKYITTYDGHCTERIVKFVEKQLKK